MERLRGAVALHLQNIQFDLVMIIKPVFVAGGKIPENATANVVAPGLNANGLGHRQAAVGMDQDVGVIIQDSLIGKNKAGA